MPATKRLRRHLSVVVALPLMAALTPFVLAQQPDPTGESTFVVLVRGSRMGTETVSVSRSGNDWLLSSTGQLAPPIDLVTTKFELRYGPDWQPQQLAIEALDRGQSVALSSTFGVTSAVNDVTQGQRRASNTQQVSPRSVVLPNNAFGAYEALAMRVGTLGPGSRLPLYIVPEAEVSATVDRVTPRRVALPGDTIEIREFALTLATPGGPVPMELWVDERHRLVRLVLPRASLVVIRDDVATVMARVERVRNPGDEDVFVPANGFSIGATVTKPVGAPQRAPAVVLVSSAGPHDRDHTSYGVPVFGQLAAALSQAGYLTVRYDSRGLGQSGGRIEKAGLPEYADDLVRLVNWLRKRRDVDSRRVALVGYGEGGPIAMLAAQRQRNVAALGLIAAPGRTGRDVVLEQQQRLLSGLTLSEADKAAKIAFEAHLIDAVITGKGWDTIPQPIRAHVDTVWFKSWVLFDPTMLFRRINQPVLILHGALDTEIPPAHADALEALSRERNKAPETHTRKTILPDLNHLLVSVPAGSQDEYSTPPGASVSPAVVEAITGWLADVMPPR